MPTQEAVQGREYVCAQCLRRAVADTAVGPLPRVCDDCFPGGAERRRHLRMKNRATQRARLGYGQPMLKRYEHECGEPGRDALARAVLRLTRLSATAGIEDTRRALRVVAAVALAWERKLGS